MLLGGALVAQRRGGMTPASNPTRRVAHARHPDAYAVALEQATRRLLELNVAVREACTGQSDSPRFGRCNPSSDAVPAWSSNSATIWICCR